MSREARKRTSWSFLPATLAASSMEFAAVLNVESMATEREEPGTIVRSLGKLAFKKRSTKNVMSNTVTASREMTLNHIRTQGSQIRVWRRITLST